MSNEGIDFERLRGAFAVEAAELLATLEEGLLALEQAPDLHDRIHDVFRAAHSLKGGAALFGLTSVVSVTHELETLLDRWRNRQLVPTRLHFDVLLKASDWLRAALDPAGGLAPDVSGLLTELVGLGGTPAHGGAPAGAAAAGAGATSYRIRFAPVRNAYLFGGDPLLVIRELRGLATTFAVEHDALALPALEALEPESSYLAWTITLTPAAGVTHDRIADAFAFIEDNAEIVIEPVFAAPAPAADAGAGPADVAPPVGDAGAPDALPAAAGARPADAAGDRTLRVAVEKVDALVDLVGELVISHSVIRELVRRGGPGTEELADAVLRTERHLRELQERVMAVRTVPVRDLYARVPRIVREVSARLGKQVRLEVEGADTELDKGLVERLVDPVLHLVRNALDHGLELPARRLELGKPVTGTVKIETYARGGSVFLEVSDDGRGLDRARILAVARERGLVAPDVELSDAQVFSLISAPGFSTATEVTDLSGRGVGLDVVRSNIERIGGELTISSEPGHGTRFRLRLPLTLTIMEGLQVTAGGQTWVLPTVDVAFSTRLTPQQVRSLVGTGDVVDLDGETLPLVSLARVLRGHAAAPAAGSLAVVVQAGQLRYALQVEGLLGQAQVVVKSIERHFRRLPGVMGATILGDGKVALIIDAHGVAAATGLRDPGDAVRVARSIGSNLS